MVKHGDSPSINASFHLDQGADPEQDVGVHVHAVVFCKRSNFADKYMVRSEDKRHTPWFLVYGFAQQEVKWSGGERLEGKGGTGERTCRVLVAGEAPDEQPGQGLPLARPVGAARERSGAEKGMATEE